jgi:hypothetical protein
MLKGIEMRLTTCCTLDESSSAQDTPNARYPCFTSNLQIMSFVSISLCNMSITSRHMDSGCEAVGVTVRILLSRFRQMSSWDSGSTLTDFA